MADLMKNQKLILSKSGFYLSGPIARKPIRCCARVLLMLTSILFLIQTAQAQTRFTFTITCSPDTGPSQVGLDYLATCVGSGGSLPYKWSINPGSLPA